MPKAKASLHQHSISSSSPRLIYLNESKVWDAIAVDPKLLVFLKAYRNTVHVPRHWCQKRKFLQGKRGIEKQPFQLPDFIVATGIAKIRQAAGGVTKWNAFFYNFICNFDLELDYLFLGEWICY
ncbi:hypothetical protein Ddye_009117 [Dipteronia dyeriana]|uniref:DUF382 domain-containing protein n=1 Tax=Dipteronia dyeriana TaxID=168575 RepID=A0AAE0CLY6_9ROSI|nr:hypothetical protein Ddye_009117 [Dipteronia dyeriana]